MAALEETDLEGAIDRCNQRAWRARGTLEHFRRLEGFTDGGEQAALERVRERLRRSGLLRADPPILDLGIGTGRTIPLLQSLSADYTGIDYVPEMVALARRLHPEARVLCADARALPFESGRFGLVVFSFNGIDAVGHRDRLKILREVRRVLRPGGLFLFSTHNQDGPGHREVPRLLPPTLCANPARLAWRLGRSAVAFAAGVYHRRQRRALEQGGERYSMRTAGAHGFAVVVHYTTLRHELAELAEAGFDAQVEVYESDGGRRLPADEPASRCWWFHLIAQRAGVRRRSAQPRPRTSPQPSPHLG